MTKRYMTGDGEGGDCVIEADSAAEAAEEWASEGDWGDGKIIIQVHAVEVDSDDEPIEYGDDVLVSVTVGSDPEPPECAPGGEHDWQDESVGSLGGTQIATRERCSRCGAYRRYVSESTPGQCPETPAQTTYLAPDDESERMVHDGVTADLVSVLTAHDISDDDLEIDIGYGSTHDYRLPVESEEEGDRIAALIEADRPEWTAVCCSQEDGVEIEIPAADHYGYDWADQD